MQSVHLMGEGYEPHVVQEGGKLIYSLPVDSVLEITAHTVLQHSTLKGNDRLTQRDFDNLVADTLHSTPEFLQSFISQISHDHHIGIEGYAQDIMARRSLAK